MISCQPTACSHPAGRAPQTFSLSLYYRFHFIEWVAPLRSWRSWASWWPGKTPSLDCPGDKVDKLEWTKHPQAFQPNIPPWGEKCGDDGTKDKENVPQENWNNRGNSFWNSKFFNKMCYTLNDLYILTKSLQCWLGLNSVRWTVRFPIDLPG